MKYVKVILLILATIITAGCFGYKVPLSEKQGLPIDHSILGIWEPVNERGEGNPEERMTIIKFSGTEYSIRQGQALETAGSLRAYPIKVAGISCFQYTMTMSPTKDIPAGSKIYAVMSLQVVNGYLVRKILNEKLVNLNLGSSAELRKAFLAHKDDQNLFIPADRFRRANLNESRQQIEEKNRRIQALNTKLVELLTAGNAAFTAKNYDLAINLYDRGVALDREQMTFYQNKAAALRQRGAERYNAGVSLSKTDKNKGIELCMKGLNDIEASIATVDQALELYRKMRTSNSKPTTDQAKQEAALLSEKVKTYDVLLQTLTGDRYIPKARDAYSEYHKVESDPTKREKAFDRLYELYETCHKNLSNNYTVSVNSFVNTGIVVNYGDKVMIRASGFVDFGGFAGRGGPKGISFNEDYNYFDNILHGGLIGKVRSASNNNQWFYIGTGGEFTYKAGILDLDVNDNDPSNNTGQFKVEISICRAH